MTQVNIGASRLISYLSVAKAQRKRSWTKAVQDYGPDAAVCHELNSQIIEIDQCITELMHADAKKKK